MQKRRTKIVATLGPACQELGILGDLLAAGVDVVRINGSHGDHKTHAQAIRNVRTLSAQMGRPVGILFDLQGPKIRIGTFAGPPKVVAHNDVFALAVGRPPTGDELPCDYPFLDRDVQVGAPLLIDDGNLMGEVISVVPGRVEVRAQHAGIIAQRKGINLPASDVSAPAISEKDRADALFAVAHEVDFIAMSFVRKAQDITDLRDLLRTAGNDIAIIAKIEKPQALDNLDAILEAAWGVMVARGDLGVELSTSEVPMAQKRIIREARAKNKPVITATQMLDSMTRNPRPTRAEASDVANAVLDGTDAVMLSQETAAGMFVVKTVTTMGEIIDAVEQHEGQELRRRQPHPQHTDIPKVLAQAACAVAQQLDAPAIATYTETGRMALLTSQRRPSVPIIAFANRAFVRNRLALVWGVQPFMSAPSATMSERLAALDAMLRAQSLAIEGQHVVLLLGAPNGPSGSTHLIMVHGIGQHEADAQGLHGAVGA